LSRGSNPCSYLRKPLVSYRINRQLFRVDSSSTDDSRLRGALAGPDSCAATKPLGQLSERMVITPRREKAHVRHGATPLDRAAHSGSCLRSLARLIRSSDCTHHQLAWPSAAIACRSAFSPPVDDIRRTATIVHKRMGTARKVPTGPHIQVQHAMERKTRNGLIVSR
jgi:hypothetical protein